MNKPDFFFLGLYYGMSIALISLSTALNVFTLNVHHKGLRGHKVPYCLKRVFFGIIAKMLFLKIDLPVAPEEGMVWHCYCYKTLGFFCYKKDLNFYKIPKKVQ